MCVCVYFICFLLLLVAIHVLILVYNFHALFSLDILILSYACSLSWKSLGRDNSKVFIVHTN